jgi:hypothetical protein
MRGTSVIGKSTEVHGSEKLRSPCTATNTIMLTNVLKSADAIVTHASISRGKTTFFTRLAFETMIPGARLIHSEKKLKTISPAKRITANSVLLSEASCPHLDLKMPEKTTV